MNEQSQTNLMHRLRFRERQALTYEAGQPLAQRVIPSLNVSRLPGILAASGGLLLRDDLVVSLPEVRVAMPGLICLRDRLPELATSLLTAVADDKGYELARRTAERDPDPTLVDAPQDEGPQLVQLQDGRLWVSRIRLNQRLAQGRERRFFFLSQPLTVLRETPKVRVRLRKLLRSW